MDSMNNLAPEHWPGLRAFDICGRERASVVVRNAKNIAEAWRGEKRISTLFMDGGAKMLIIPEDARLKKLECSVACRYVMEVGSVEKYPVGGTANGCIQVLVVVPHPKGTIPDTITLRKAPAADSEPDMPTSKSDIDGQGMKKKTYSDCLQDSPPHDWKVLGRGKNTKRWNKVDDHLTEAYE